MYGKVTRVQPTKPTTVYYRLIDEKLGGKFDEFVAEHRATLSWDEIAEAIFASTGETVTRETLRAWFAGRLREERKVTVR